MTIAEAKARLNNSDDEAVKILLEYVRYAEDNYKKLKETSKAHQGLVGKLYKQVDER